MYDGAYEISNQGNIRSVDRVVSQQGREQIYKGKLLRAYINNSGYCCIRLSKQGKKKNHLIHRLVAEHFIPNGKGLPVVNHKDENKMNNKASNLEWCTVLYNVNYGTIKEKRIGKGGKQVCMYNMLGEYVRSFVSIRDAERQTGINHIGISLCCRNKSYMCGGFIWRYKTDTHRNNILVKRGARGAKQVYQYDLNWKLLNVFMSARLAEQATGVRHEYISRCCRNRSSPNNTFNWSYERIG